MNHDRPAMRFSVLLLSQCVAQFTVTQWFVEKSYKGKSCDEVCALVPLDDAYCQESELDALNGGTKADFLARYNLAGHTCNGIMTGCETCGNTNDCCVSWGSPYIHTGGGSPNGHFERGDCWGGSIPAVAPCSQRPRDGQHTRLCPCRGGTRGGCSVKIKTKIRKCIFEN